MMLGGDWHELEGKRCPIPSFCDRRTISASWEKKLDMTASWYRV
jgi:hypothetical protein